mgnify:CR=1 FL=1
MKITCTLLSISLLLIHFAARADHILGGQLSYTHITANTYKITLTMYGDCAGGTFYHLKNAHPEVNILNKEGGLFTLILQEDGANRKEVSDVCPSEINNTTCRNPQGTVPGVTRFSYSATAQLPPSATWRILFAGHMDNSGKSQTGLSMQISNIKYDRTYGFHLYLEATLNNLDGPNSTPSYTYEPTPFYCINQPHQYNQGVSDADNDVLRFRLLEPLTLNGTMVEYIAPNSATHPFSTQPGAFFYDSTNGQFSFTPSKTEVALVVNKILEYRNGVMVGSSMRGMTFFIRNNCNNSSPYGNIDASTVVGGLLHNNSVNLCDGEHKVAFSIPVTDNNNDNIQVSLSNVPAGATTSINGNGTKSPVIDFNWDMTNVPPGNYTFFANYNDGVCPVPGNQVMAYSVNVVEPFSIFHEVMEPTNCIKNQTVRFHLDGGALPRVLVVKNMVGDTVGRYTDVTGSVDADFRTGQYKAHLYASDLPCSSDYNFEVTDYGTYPYPPEFEDIHHCLNEPAALVVATPAPGGKVQWYDMQQNKLSNAPAYTTDSIRNFQWLVNQKVKTCESVYDTFDVSIHEYPDIQIQNEGGHVCVGDGMYLTATGGVRYEWQPESEIVYYDNQPYTYIYKPTTFVVKGYSEYDCAKSDTVIYDDIEQCCLFSYPNAFTPDGNGTNDGWHPITYGNVDFYLLSVYNRWGQRIYTSSDPKEKWDGTFLGKKCDVGSYHYYLRAKCITGHEEKARGSFVLLR